jgi:hypothetical protein
MRSGLVGGLAGGVGMFIDRSRNSVCRTALNAGATHVWFIDQDMVIPDGTLARLVSHGAPVVGGLYFDRTYHMPVAFMYDPPRPFMDLPEDTAEPVQVDGIGMGCTLIDCRVLVAMSKRFGDEYWFKYDGDGHDGEDVFFSKRCAEMGLPIYLDTAVRCGHVREEVVTEAHWRAVVAQGATIGR